MKMDPHAAQAIYDSYMNLSHEAVAKAAADGGGPIDLIVWPETMFRDTLYSFAPGFKPPAAAQAAIDRRVADTDEMIALTAHDLGAALLLGIDRARFLTADQTQNFNSALFVAADGRQLGHYDKMHPVMFGEYVPFADRFPFLYRLTPLPGGLTAGDAPYAETIHSGRHNVDLRFAPSICYETTIPHLIRRQINDLGDRGQEPDVLVNLTNDGWFWGSSELDLHLMLRRFPGGRVPQAGADRRQYGLFRLDRFERPDSAQGPRRKEGVIIADVVRDPRHSPYLEIGDWPSAICLLACGALGIIGFFGRRRDRAAE